MEEVKTLSIINNVSPFVLMEGIIEKLKVLNYEQSFLQSESGKDFPPLTHTYFAVPARNPNSQFHYFGCLVSWAMELCGNNFPPPSLYDDPNAVTANIVEELKHLRLEPDFPPSKLRTPYGETICTVLTVLLDFCMAKQNISFAPPVFPPASAGFMIGEAPEEEGEEGDQLDDSGLVAFESDEEEEEDLFNEKGENSEDAGIIDTGVDPTEWRMELERVTPRLKLHLQADQRDWRTHIEQIEEYFEDIEQMKSPITSNLANIAEDIDKVSEKILKREKMLSTQFEGLLKEYKESHSELSNLTAMNKNNTDRVSELSNRLKKISEELEDVKNEAEERKHQVSDSTPLESLRTNMKKIKEEIKNMDLRMGIAQNKLLQYQKNSEFLDYQEEDEDELDDDFF
eukprot:gb/GECH01009633.1/.p1 GENE.gb/GECH01009633.1/~~gb/GECH01009633.1/.p1  ORF type:complete len:399 (+),score=128.57 gb/GECH01009633.1/:1-1197(+)